MKTPAKNHLQYYLLSPTNPPRQFVELHDRAFTSWMEITQRAFQEVQNADTTHLHDDFARQDLIGCLCSGEEVVATFLHSFSSIYAKASRTFRYMRENYPEVFFQKIESLGIQNVMTSHYLAVNPRWRRGLQDIQVAPLMIGFTPLIRDLFQADAFIGVYRRDRKVHEIAYGFGGECIVENVLNHNTPCDLILINKATPHTYPSRELESQVTGLWNQRIDTFRLPSQADKVAA